MTGYLLDTNHLSAVLRNEPNVGGRLSAARRNGSRIGTCHPVLCELAVGIEQTARREQNWRALNVFLRQVRVWPIDMPAIREYGRVYQQLRQAGRVLSQVDMMIIALARRMKLIVLTTDRDFDASPDIETQSWIV